MRKFSGLVLFYLIILDQIFCPLAGSPIIVLTNRSTDRLRNGVWVLLVHHSFCRDPLCMVLRHALLLLSKDSDIEKANIQLGELDGDANRIAIRKLGTTGNNPRVVLVKDGQVFYPVELFGSFDEMKRFALNEGRGLKIRRSLDDVLLPDFQPAPFGLASLVLLLIGTTMIVFYMKGSLFNKRCIEEIVKRKTEVANRINKQGLWSNNQERKLRHFCLGRRQLSYSESHSD